MKKVLVIDTSVLCVWLQVPGKESCGPDDDRWDYERVYNKMEIEKAQGTLFILPLATIIETGNHIAQSAGDRYATAKRLAELMKQTALEIPPWASFETQSAELWTGAQLKELADTWPILASQKLSLGDATIKKLADYYAQMGRSVEIFTGDQGLKAYEPLDQTKPSRRNR